MIRIVVFLLLGLNVNSYSQWVRVGDFNREIRALCADTNSGRLVIGGAFTRVNNLPTSGIAAFDGLDFDTGFVNAGGIVTAISSFRDTIYIGGYFQVSNSASQAVRTGGFAKRCGTGWCAAYGNGTNGVVRDFTTVNSELWVAGGFDTINGSYSPYLFAFDGVSVRPIGLPNSIFRGALITDMAQYDGRVYCVGTFSDTLGSVYNFASVETNGSWSQVCQPSWCRVFLSAEEYNNKLLVSGSTITSPSQCVFGYDGFVTSATGIGLNAAAIQLKELNGYLFAVGYFDEADGLPASRIAIWNGISWSAFSPSQIDNAVASIEVFNNELYIGGGFRFIDGDSIPFLAKYNGDWTLIADSIISAAGALKAYPNPASEYIKLQWPVGLAGEQRLRVTDLYGRTVLTANPAPGTSCWSLDCSSLPPGSYQISLTAGARSGRAQVMVVH